MPQILALASAALFGVADFTGALASRKVTAWVVTAWAQIVALPILFIGLIVVAAPETTRTDLLWGALGGVFGVVGLAIMYATLAAGTMSVVAPIIGAGAATVPVVWAVATGESISWINWFGIFLAGIAVVLVASQSDAGRLDRRLMLQAIIAATAFAVFFIALGQTHEESGLWPLAAARACTLPLGIAVVLLGNSQPKWPKGAWGLVVTAGAFDITANVAIVLALQRGSLAINAVLGSLYPVFTVAAAVVVLRERPSRRQLLGIGLAVIAMVSLAL